MTYWVMGIIIEILCCVYFIKYIVYKYNSMYNGTGHMHAHTHIHTHVFFLTDKVFVTKYLEYSAVSKWYSSMKVMEVSSKYIHS